MPASIEKIAHQVYNDDLRVLLLNMFLGEARANAHQLDSNILLAAFMTSRAENEPTPAMNVIMDIEEDLGEQLSDDAKKSILNLVHHLAWEDLKYFADRFEKWGGGKITIDNLMTLSDGQLSDAIGIPESDGGEIENQINDNEVETENNAPANNEVAPQRISSDAVDINKPDSVTEDIDEEANARFQIFRESFKIAQAAKLIAE